MTCCSVARNGRTGSIDALRVFGTSVTTTNAALQSYRVGALPVVGAALAVYVTVVGMQDGGQTFGRANLWWDAGRNGVASGDQVSGTIFNGYIDPAAPPFTTPGFPGTWAVPAIVVAANIVSVTWSGAVGQVVRWRVTGTRSFVGGATP